MIIMTYDFRKVITCEMIFCKLKLIGVINNFYKTSYEVFKKIDKGSVFR